MSSIIFGAFKQFGFVLCMVFWPVSYSKLQKKGNQQQQPAKECSTLALKSFVSFFVGHLF